MQRKTLNVIHSIDAWLPTTQKWMYDELIYLPKNIKNHVLCEYTTNIDQFKIDDIHSIHDIHPTLVKINNTLKSINLNFHFNSFREKIVTDFKVKILHSHFGPTAWYNLKVARKTRIKHVVSFYGFDVGFIPLKWEKWRKRYDMIFKEVDAVLCEGPFMAQSIINLGCPKDKVIVHHLGVGVEKIEYKPREWNKNEPLRVLIASSFTEKKGIPFGIAALGKLKKEVPLQITLIGDGIGSSKRRKEKEIILSMIKQYKLDSHTRLLGYQPYDILMREAYNHHIYLSPSITASDGDSEGGVPVSLIEMSASGMPVVSTRHCDIPEVIKYNSSCQLADERDIDGLVNCFRWLINNVDKWRNILDKNRQHIELEYNASLQGKKLAKIYQGLIEN